jgi:hypothetical protein
VEDEGAACATGQKGNSTCDVGILHRSVLWNALGNEMRGWRVCISRSWISRTAKQQPLAHSYTLHATKLKPFLCLLYSTTAVAPKSAHMYAWVASHENYHATLPAACIVQNNCQRPGYTTPFTTPSYRVQGSKKRKCSERGRCMFAHRSEKPGGS